MRSELEKQGRSFGMTAWFYRYLYDVLPEEKKTAYQKAYQMRQVKAMISEQELKRLYHVLAGYGLRFVPIKGADLTYRLYPDAALRTFSDWDIWFHPDDCDRVLVVLAEDGWKVPEYYSDDHEAVRASNAHHFSPHVRGQFSLEPHFTLANFENVDLYEMWKETREYPPGDGQRILSPEMDLLMLARHAASKSYYHAHIPKLLIDAAMVMQRDKIDFDKIHSLVDRWQLPYPGDLFAAFPEFFPADVINLFGANPTKSKMLRNVFEMRGQLGEPESVALALGRYEAHGHVLGKMLNHIRILNHKRIRLIYQLPRHGAWGRVLLSYVYWFITRSSQAMSWVWRNTKLMNYTHLVESIESGKAEHKE